MPLLSGTPSLTAPRTPSGMCSLTVLAMGLRGSPKDIPKGESTCSHKAALLILPTFRDAFAPHPTPANNALAVSIGGACTDSLAYPAPIHGTPECNGAEKLNCCWPASSPQFRSRLVEDGTPVGQSRWRVGALRQLCDMSPLGKALQITGPVINVTTMDAHCPAFHKRTVNLDSSAIRSGSVPLWALIPGITLLRIPIPRPST